ncbi:hypothetical protein DTO212C5_7203 [Paecilomyces variotii]|nr:hypothetical protein DTO212C5_7203 [Paecilomyces variotii]
MPPCKSAEAALSAIKDDESKVLGLTVNGNKVEPGQHIPKAEATSPPELSFNTTSGTYLVINVDLDAPFKSFNFLGPVLHWVQSGLTPEMIEGGTSVLKPHDTPVIANYARPGPPPGSGPHRYVFLLYEQPEGFDVTKYAPAGGKPVGVRRRMRYDLDAFEKKANLGPVIAANYFTSN